MLRTTVEKTYSGPGKSGRVSANTCRQYRSEDKRNFLPTQNWQKTRLWTLRSITFPLTKRLSILRSKWIATEATTLTTVQSDRIKTLNPRKEDKNRPLSAVTWFCRQTPRSTCALLKLSSSTDEISSSRLARFTRTKNELSLSWTRRTIKGRNLRLWGTKHFWGNGVGRLRSLARMRTISQRKLVIFFWGFKPLDPRSRLIRPQNETVASRLSCANALWMSTRWWKTISTANLKQFKT